LFCGYFFNDLGDGWETRLSDFCNLLERPIFPSAASLHTTAWRKVSLTPAAHVSFDNYSYLFEELGEHGGEFADIFLHDRSTRTMVCIEAKFHGNWNYEKDIKENSRRVSAIAQRLGDCNAVHCLLIKDEKWRAVQKLVNHAQSQWKMVLNDVACSTRFFTWEQFIGICPKTKAAEYLSAQLRRNIRRQKGTPAARYRFVNGWMDGD
jgi:hypothetical protein